MSNPNLTHDTSTLIQSKILAHDLAVQSDFNRTQAATNREAANILIDAQVENTSGEELSMRRDLAVEAAHLALERLVDKGAVAKGTLEEVQADRTFYGINDLPFGMHFITHKAAALDRAVTADSSSKSRENAIKTLTAEAANEETNAEMLENRTFESVWGKQDTKRYTDNLKQVRKSNAKTIKMRRSVEDTKR